MKIENFVRIIDGKLRTSPLIDAFGSIHFELSRISHGDLFIDLASSREDVLNAIQKGAYAIVTTLVYQNDDEESAWIEVNSIETTLIKLLRFIVTQKSIQLMVMSSIQMGLLEQIQTPKVLKPLKGDLVFIAKQLLNAKENDAFFSDNKHLIANIAPAALHVASLDASLENTLAKGLFLSSFSYRERYFNECKLPAHFVASLGALLTFCDEHDVAYSLENLSFTEHFFPQFINHTLHKKEFGSSDKALIFEPSPELLEHHLVYLKETQLLKQTLICLPQTVSVMVEDAPVFIFETLEMLHEHLKTASYSYALIALERASFEPYYTKAQTQQLTLF